MFRSILFSALVTATLLPAGAWAQSPPANQASGAPPITDDESQNLSQKIRDRLQSEGFKDVVVRPSSFVVRARDQNDKPVMMLIGPEGMTMITKPPTGNSPTGNSPMAEPPNGQDQIIQE